MKTFEKLQDKFLDKLTSHLEKLPEDERRVSVIEICRTAIIHVSDSHVEELGFTELLKEDLKDFFKFCMEEDKKDKE